MKRPLILLTLLLMCSPAFGQDVQVQALVSGTTIGHEEVLVYSVQVQGASPSDVETPEAPSTQGLTLLQRMPSTQRNMTIFNGKLEQSVAFQWSYRPVSKGAARIDPTEVTVAGTRYTTDPIEITVVDQSQRPQRSRSPQQWPFVLRSQPQGEDDEAQSIDKKDLFIRAIPSKHSAHQNEQVTIEYQLFFRDGIQLRHSRLAGSWDAEGFWREEFNVDTRPIPRSVVEDGLLYHTIVLKRVAVFPTRAGTLTVDPLKIETEAYFPVGSSDPFERFFSLRNRFETVELASEPVRIRVEPLPPDAPPSFTGAVGEYDMRAAVSRTTVEVGEPVEMTITLTGTGNLATLSPPAFEPPGIFEQYEPDVRTSIDRDTERIRGTKAVTHVLVPRSNGTFEMPPVTFTYFSPETGRYRTLEAGLAPVTVTGTAAPFAAGTTANGLPVDDIAGILTTAESWDALNDRPLHRRTWPYLILLLPIGLLAALYVYQRRTHRLATDERYARGRIAHPLAKKHLKRAESLLKNDQPRAFYEEIERAVTGFIGNRLNIAELGLTHAQLESRLDVAGVPPDVRAILRRLLEECDQARFAPILPDREAMLSARERAAHVIVAVDEAVQNATSSKAAA